MLDGYIPEVATVGVCMMCLLQVLIRASWVRSVALG